MLVLRITTDLRIGALRFAGAPAFANVPPGEHLLMISMSEGRYRWDALSFVAETGHELHWRLLSTAETADLLSFHVEAGRTNYVGDLIIRGEESGGVLSWTGEIQNRSAEVGSLLIDRYPELLRRHPPHFGGWHRDDYLDHLGRTFLGTTATPTVDPAS